MSELKKPAPSFFSGRGLRVLRWVALISVVAALGLWPLAFLHHEDHGKDQGKDQGENVVNLEGYGSFSGTSINASRSGQDLPHAVDAWLGIDYATQPVGKARFQPLTNASSFSGVRAASNFGKVCPQNPSVEKLEDQDEACLSFNVFRPQGIPFNETLPVLVWIHGGSFNTGGWRNFDGPSFVARSDSPLMVVTFHYRLGSLGFLPSALFEEEGLLNLGLRDQRFFLEFLQTHIASFGGDPAAITLGGQSAGAHAVGIQYFHHYGDAAADRDPLFARAIHQSGSVTARAFPNATYPLYAEQMKEYMDGLGCSLDGSNADALDCLRGVDVSRIRDVATNVYRKYNRALTWAFQPVQGGPLLEKPGSESGYDETFFHVPVITTTTTDEGRLFIPGDIQTNQGFIDYLHNLSPALNQSDLRQLDDLYPDPTSHSRSPYASSPRSKQFSRLAAAYSDYAYICPSQETAYRTSLDGVPTWKARFNANNHFPAWRGIPHTADSKYAWGAPDVQYPEVSLFYHAYLASFVVAGDPNTHRYQGSPEWPQYHGADDIVRASGNDDGDTWGDKRLQLVVQPTDTKAEHDKIRAEACLYWRDRGRAPRLDK